MVEGESAPTSAEALTRLAAVAPSGKPPPFVGLAWGTELRRTGRKPRGNVSLFVGVVCVAHAVVTGCGLAREGLTFELFVVVLPGLQTGEARKNGGISQETSAFGGLERSRVCLEALCRLCNSNSGLGD